MRIESTSSFDTLNAYKSRIETIINDQKGFYVLCEGVENEGDLSAANFVRLALDIWININAPIIESYNRNRDYLTLELIEEKLIDTIKSLNTQSYKENLSTRPCTSVSVVIILEGYAIIMHTGAGGIYSSDLSGADSVSHPQTKYNDRIKNIGNGEGGNKKEEQSMISQCFGRGPEIQIESIKIPIANDLFVVALSTAANTLHYDPTFLPALHSKHSDKSGDIKTWIQNQYWKNKGDRFDFLVIRSVTSEAEKAESTLRDELRVISKLPLFKSIENNLTALKLVHSLVTFRSFEPSDGYLFRTTEKVTNLYVLLSGQVGVFKQGKQKLLADSTKNSLLGEVSIFLESEKYVSDTKILAPGRAMVIPKDKLLNLITNNSRFGVHFMLNVTKEISRKEAQLLDQ